MREDNQPERLFEKPANLRFYPSKISGYSDYFTDTFVSISFYTLWKPISAFCKKIHPATIFFIFFMLSGLALNQSIFAGLNASGVTVNFTGKPDFLLYNAKNDGRLVFKNEKFEDIALKLEKWFGVKIIILNPKLKEVKITGLFENETIVQVLEALKIAVPFDYKINNKEILIY